MKGYGWTYILFFLMVLCKNFVFAQTHISPFGIPNELCDFQVEITDTQYFWRDEANKGESSIIVRKDSSWKYQYVSDSIQLLSSGFFLGYNIPCFRVHEPDSLPPYTIRLRDSKEQIPSIQLDGVVYIRDHRGGGKVELLANIERGKVSGFGYSSLGGDKVIFNIKDGAVERILFENMQNKASFGRFCILPHFVLYPDKKITTFSSSLSLGFFWFSNGTLQGMSFLFSEHPYIEEFVEKYPNERFYVSDQFEFEEGKMVDKHNFIPPSIPLTLFLEERQKDLPMEEIRRLFLDEFDYEIPSF